MSHPLQHPCPSARAKTVPLLCFCLLLASATSLEALVDLDLVASTSPETVDSTVSHTTWCPSGKVAVGGGGSISGTPSDGRTLVQSLPQGDPPTGWSVYARDLGTDGELWTVTAWVWCAQAPPGFVRTGTTTDFGPFDFRALYHDCPDGTSMLSAGVGVFGTATTAAPYSLAPSNFAADVPWRAVGRRSSGDSGSWLLRIDLLCAAVPKPLVFPSKGRATWRSGQHLEAHCPPGWLPLGGGIEAVGKPTLVYRLRDFFPVPGSFADFPVGWWVGITEVPVETLPGGALVLRTYGLRQWTLCHQVPVFADGFESGSVSAWSGSTP